MKDLIYKHSLLNAMEHEGKADVNAVLGKVLAEDSSLKENIKQVVAEIGKIVKDVNSQSLEQQKRLLSKLGVMPEKKIVVESGIPQLNNAVNGKVVMRLAPYPSGPLHIGNARMVILNDEYVRRNNGKLLLVFDDTIGSEEKFVIPEAYKMITDGLKWLGVKCHKVFYKSDRMKIFYDAAKELIEKDSAYVCECDVKTMRDNRAEGLTCPHRDQTIKKNMEKWGKMVNGKYKQGKAVLRLKTDMLHRNPAFRDRVLFRISTRKHPRAGNKYKIWPMLEFSWAIDDHLLGITHVLRGKDLVIEDMMEGFIWDVMGWDKPEILHYGILNLDGIRLSKTESRKLIERKVYAGWDDPRTWSMQSLRKRGIKPEAVRNFVIAMGLSLTDVKIPVEILYAENRKLIDAEANRIFGVLEPVMIYVKNANIKITKAALHPDFPKRGIRKIPVNAKKIYVERRDYESFHGQEIGLMNLFSAKLGRNSLMTSKDVKYEIQKIHWVSEPNVKVKIVMPDGKTINALLEPTVKKMKVDDIVQLPRIGFFRIDKAGKERVLYFAHK